ncbi:MAG: hypothetical protein U0457_14355 [Candidatus Sericytochromatia bacterium]
MLIVDILLAIILFTLVIAFSPVGKILTEYFLGVSNEKNVIELTKKYAELEVRVREQEEELKRLREGYIIQDEKVDKLTQISKKLDIDIHN